MLLKPFGNDSKDPSGFEHAFRNHEKEIRIALTKSLEFRLAPDDRFVLRDESDTFLHQFLA